MAKKVYVENLYERDRETLEMLSKTGHATHEQMKEFIADKRITNYVRDNIVEEVKKAGQETCYKLGDKGKDILRKEYKIEDNYKARSGQHDTKITDFYIKKEDSDIFKTETEIQKEIQEKLKEYRDTDNSKYQYYQDLYDEGKMSTPDFSITTSEGVEVYYESVTSNYRQADIEAKIVVSEFMQREIEFI